MTTRRPILLLALCSAFVGAPLQAQSFVVRGGPSILTNPSAQLAESGDVAANVHVGGRLWLSELFQVQGTLGYDSRFTTEASLYIRPFDDAMKLEPYAFFGFGYRYGDAARRTTVPAGLGVEYQAKPNLGLFFELAGRWQSERNAAPGSRVNNLNFSVAPMLGVSFTLRGRPQFQTRGERERFGAGRSAYAANENESVVGDAAEEEAGFPALGVRSTSAAAPSAIRTEWAQPQDSVEDLGEQVRVPDGTFIMGLTDEDPLLLQTSGLKRVTVSSFIVDKHEVTNAEYRAYMNERGGAQSGLLPDAEAWTREGSAATLESYFQNETYDDYPVVAVTWAQAEGFCQAQDGRLPTEAEWEYTARSGRQGGIYPWPGFEPRDPQGSYLANFSPGRGLYAADGYAFTAPVDAFSPTPWGLYNVSGNVAEWVQDSYVASYSALTNFNPRYVDEGEPRRVVRGGSWASDDFYIGVGVRDAQAADEANIYTGFRCVYDLGARIPGDIRTDGESSEPARSSSVSTGGNAN